MNCGGDKVAHFSLRGPCIIYLNPVVSIIASSNIINIYFMNIHIYFITVTQFATYKLRYFIVIKHVYILCDKANCRNRVSFLFYAKNDVIVSSYKIYLLLKTSIMTMVNHDLPWYIMICHLPF